MRDTHISHRRNLRIMKISKCVRVKVVAYSVILGYSRSVLNIATVVGPIYEAFSKGKSFPITLDFNVDPVLLWPFLVYCNLRLLLVLYSLFYPIRSCTSLLRSISATCLAYLYEITSINICAIEIKWDGKITKIWYDNEMRWIPTSR